LQDADVGYANQLWFALISFISLTCTLAQEAALRQGVALTVTRPLSDYTDAAQQPLALQLAGAHQEQNAALAVALAASWEGSERGGASVRTAPQKPAPLPNGTSALSNGHSADRAALPGPASEDDERGSAMEHAADVQAGCLSAPYIYGLRNVSWPGRNQVRLSAAFMTLHHCMPFEGGSSPVWELKSP